ncbi:MAG: CopG family transcriptional regulator [Epsilonproteobacteria bacterium]|nr:MAG: CopG family transcriptional regulator [Campylobacterota bacterium]
MKQAVSVELEKDVVQYLDGCAKELNKTRTNLIEKAIEYYFDRLDEIVSDKRIDDINSGKTELYTLEQVAKKLELN